MLLLPSQFQVQIPFLPQKETAVTSAIPQDGSSTASKQMQKVQSDFLENTDKPWKNLINVVTHSETVSIMGHSIYLINIPEGEKGKMSTYTLFHMKGRGIYG